MSRLIRYLAPSSSELPPQPVSRNGRPFLRAAGILGAGAALSACGVRPPASAAPGVAPVAGSATDELGDPLTAFDAVTHYNNYYEFSTDKEAVADFATTFPTRPWTVEVGGLVNKPGTFAIDELLTAFPQEERVYRLRCVEGWSMVIPWLGFELGKLIDRVEPKTPAAYGRVTP